MARTSKKGKIETVTKCVWKAGIYARLSVDGSERKNESIDTQIEIAKKYISLSDDIELIDCYIDLGKTGTDFKREGFERMMSDVRQKKVNCVMVKDFSRFGRNYIETGNYIEKIFPFMKVRFIAVTDGYDSENTAADHMQLSMNLKNIVNELYAKDISQRVKTAKRIKQEIGSYTGGVPPYGYRAKKVGDRNVLIPNADTKDIVVRIFEMYAADSTYKEIAKELYQRRIQKPRVYYETGKVCCLENEEPKQWPYETIKGILSNPVYIGTLFQAGQTGHTVVEHTHEPLIEEELYFEVTKRLERQSKCFSNKKNSKKMPPNEDIFKNKIFCGICRSPLARRTAMKTFSSGERVRRYYYFCPNRARVDASACECSGIPFERLAAIVRSVLEKEFLLSEMRPKDYCIENAAETDKEKDHVRRVKEESRHRQETLMLESSKLYLQYREGRVSRKDFVEEKKKIAGQLEQLKNFEKKLHKQSQMIEKEMNRKNQFIRGLMKSGTDAEFDSGLIDCLIKKIVVYPEQRVEVIFHYRQKELGLRERINE